MTDPGPDATAGSRTRARAPIRIVHLGLGGFHRAHQVWFTELADPGWGIASFTGRTARLADELNAQDCVYTLVERSRSGDSTRLMESIVEARPGADVARLADLVARPDVAVVTLTVTEAGYHAGVEGAPARLVTALDARRRANAGPIAVVPCDNLRANGRTLRAVLTELPLDPALDRWIRDEVGFVDTVVDRITPPTTAADRDAIQQAVGFADRVPVLTEPYAEWVLSGDFPAGRPPWERAGARFVADVAAFERRKLRMLNGAHSLLAATGLIAGHRTVAEAVGDPRIGEWLGQYWTIAQDADEPRYRTQLVERFTNRRLDYPLAKIATDVEPKLRERIVPVVLDALAARRDPTPALRAVAGWFVGEPAGRSLPHALAGLQAAWRTDRDVLRIVERLATELVADGRPSSSI